MKILFIVTAIAFLFSCSNNGNIDTNSNSENTYTISKVEKFDSTGKIEIKAGDGAKWLVSYKIRQKAWGSISKDDLVNIKDLCYQEAVNNVSHFQSYKPDTSMVPVIDIAKSDGEFGDYTVMYCCLASNGFGVVDKVFLGFFIKKDKSGKFKTTFSAPA
jgi:hypothetical protein